MNLNFLKKEKEKKEPESLKRDFVPWGHLDGGPSGTSLVGPQSRSGLIWCLSLARGWLTEADEGSVKVLSGYERAMGLAGDQESPPSGFFPFLLSLARDGEYPFPSFLP